ncbi:MAG: acyltransferase family protein, partial [Terrimicrobiaceae bacterium]
MAALTLADAPPRHDNHFNLIRFLAATAVIYSHGFNAVAGPTGTDALKACIGISLGEIAVDVFFCLSGFLVAGSLLNRGSIRAFAAARALRIYPALILSVVVAVFLVGPLFTTLPLAEYFQDKMTWGYLTRNCLSINPQWFRYELPGVFNDLPSADIINSPMWTLPWEICMYLSLGILFCMRIFRGS